MWTLIFYEKYSTSLSTIVLVVLTTANFGGFSNFCRYYTRSQAGKSTRYRPTLKPLIIIEGPGCEWLRLVISDHKPYTSITTDVCLRQTHTPQVLRFWDLGPKQVFQLQFITLYTLVQAFLPKSGSHNVHNVADKLLTVTIYYHQY